MSSIISTQASGLSAITKCRSRRDALKALSVAGSYCALFGFGLEYAMADPPPETKRIRLMKASLCTAPAYVAEELLRAEGFSEVQYIDDDPLEIGTSKLVATGEADLNMSFGLTTLARVDAGEPVVLLAGVHSGCYELFATERIRSIRELRGSRVAVPGIGSTHHTFMTS